MASLRALRAAHLWSIRDLARRAGIAPSTIYLIEAGRSSPSLRVIRQLTSVLMVDAHEVDEFRRTIELFKAPARRERPAPDEGREGPGTSI